MAKMGRPKKDKTEDKSVTVRLGSETYERLLAYASETNQTLTQVVLRGLEKELSNQK